MSNENENGNDNGSGGTRAEVIAGLAAEGLRAFCGKTDVYLTLVETPRVVVGAHLTRPHAFQVRAKEGALAGDDVPDGFVVRGEGTYAKTESSFSVRLDEWVRQVRALQARYPDATYRLAL